MTNRLASHAATRPMPDAAFLDQELAQFAPAYDVADWLMSTFVEPGGVLYNEEHDHLRNASVGVLWTNLAQKRRGHHVAAQAEIPQMMGNRWTRGRADQQIFQWFGRIPNFIITFHADYAVQTDDVSWCALCEHELLHCGQAKDMYGVPQFTRDGLPRFTMRGHDVEEFVAIVERYGVGSAAGKTAQLVAAAALPPQFNLNVIKQACGTCQ